jgi:MFS family permease
MRIGEQTKKQLPWLWHGFFLAVTLSMMELNTILPGLLSELTDNRVIFGAMYSVLLGAPLLFNLPMSRFMRHYKGRRIFLLVGVYVRTLAFAGMGITVYMLAEGFPSVALTFLFLFLSLFAVGGGLAGTAYSDLAGGTFTVSERGRLFTVRQFVMGIGALLGGILVARLLKIDSLIIWDRYAIFFAIGAGGLFVGALGFWAVHEIHEQPAVSCIPDPAYQPDAHEKPGMFREAWITLRDDPRYARFILVENITSFSLMILPFYLVYAKQQFSDFASYFGTYVLLQIIGGLVSNFFWGWIFSKVGNRPVIRICITFGAMMPLLAMVTAAGGPGWYAVVFFLIGVVTSGRNIGFEPYLLEIAPDEKRTLYIGLRGTLNLLDVLLPLVGGILIQVAGFPAAFFTVSAMMLLSLFLFRNHG